MATSFAIAVHQAVVSWNGVIWVKDERGGAYHWAGQLSSRMGEDQSAATRKNLGRAVFANVSRSSPNTIRGWS